MDEGGKARERDHHHSWRRSKNREPKNDPTQRPNREKKEQMECMVNSVWKGPPKKPKFPRKEKGKKGKTRARKKHDEVDFVDDMDEARGTRLRRKVQEMFLSVVVVVCRLFEQSRWWSVALRCIGGERD